MARKKGRHAGEIQTAAGQIAALITMMLRLRDRLGVTPEEFHLLFTEAGEAHLEKMLVELKGRTTSHVPTQYLRRIFAEEKIVLGQTSGERKIFTPNGALAIIHGSGRLFNVQFGSVSQPTEPVEIMLYEVHQTAALGLLFASLGRSLESLCFTEDQIIELVLQHPDKLRCDFSGVACLCSIGGDIFPMCINENVRGEFDLVEWDFEDDILFWDGLSGTRARLVVPAGGPL